MLIAFVGSPCSGKTTVAAALFSELKNSGKSVEFFPEYAREYIMRKRFMGGGTDLTKNDQLQIYNEQKDTEEMYKTMSPNSVAITDGSTLNSYFYGLKDDLKFEQELQRYDVVFFCRGLGVDVIDENRVHDLEFSRKLDTEMADKLHGYLKPSFFASKRNICTLWGSKEERLSLALEFLNGIS